MKSKKAYTKPEVKKVTMDSEISMVMMSVSAPNGIPGLGLKKLNPLRWWK